MSCHLLYRTIAITILFAGAAAGIVAGDDARLVRITDDGAFKQRPAWSPDGKHVLFARHRGDTIFLFLRDLESGEERRLTDKESPEYDAVYSRDGKQVLFAFDKTSPNQGDLEVHRLIFDPREILPAAVSQGGLTHEESPAWSPDGKRFSFTSTKDGNQELYVASLEGGDWTRLTSDPAIDAHPAWSPDGKTILFATDRWGDLELAAISPEGGSVRRLTDSPGLDDYPAWSPDGKRIAFTSNRDRNLEIYVMDVDSGAIENVTQDPAIDNFPAWTHDGRLGFVSNRDGGFDLYILKP